MKNRILLLALISFAFANVKGQWSNLGPLSYRNWNSVCLLDAQRAVIVGGNKTNDEIRDAINTTNGGNTLNLAYDGLKPWLKSIASPTPGVCIAVGYSGTIIRTGNLGFAWDSIAAPGSAFGRDFNAIFFVNSTVGYIVGGHEANDSIQTILQTTDGGNNWTIQRDVPGPWLKSVYFTDANNGVAVGDNGTILKTTNGGTNWNVISLTGNVAGRHYNGVSFISSSMGFAVGGYPANDSIRTIIKTTDGGNSWSIVKDELGPMLNSVDFGNASKGVAVGNYGTAFGTIDAGANWAPENLPSGGVLDTVDLNCVKFLNADFGMLVGRYGKITKYVSPITTTPTVTTVQASKVSNNSAQLNLLVNPNGYSTNLSFEYKANPASVWNTISLAGNINGNTIVSDSVLLTGLTPNTFYQFRAKGTNANGSGFGAVIQFYTSNCEVPNCDFEIWDTLYMDKPGVWNVVGRTYKVPSYNGSTAVQMGPGSESAILLASIATDQPTGGIAFAARPDSITMHAKYDIAPGDTAFIIMVFKKNGVYFPWIFIPITGSSAGNFDLLQYPVVFADTITPDSLMFGITSTNVFSHQQGGDPASVMTVDDVYFTGTNIALPNWDFEQWDTVSDVRPRTWYSSVYSKEGTANRIAKVTDAVTGQFALRLTNRPNNGIDISVGDTVAEWNQPTFAVAGKHLTLNMYLKYLQQGNDSLSINLNMFYQGNGVGSVNAIIDTPILNYTPFSFDIYYGQPNIIPDSASLRINVEGQHATGNTSLYIDNISFDGFRVPTGISKVIQNNIAFAIYPNPSASKVTVCTEQLNESKLEIFDFTGKLVHAVQLKSLKAELDVSQFADGIYLVKISNADKTATQKLIIAH